MQILTVLKSGGVYVPEHVERLYGSVRRWGEGYFDFICLTDLPKEDFSSNIRVIPLQDNLPGWWSKMEVFREDLPQTSVRCFVDIDTVFVGPMRKFATSQVEGIWMIKDFNRGNPATGMMTWKRDLTFLFDEVKGWMESHKITEENWRRHWDQRYVAEKLREREIQVEYYQDVFPFQLVSYKLHCLLSVPLEARVVCFHGDPRPWTVKEDWVTRNWKAHHVPCFGS